MNRIVIMRALVGVALAVTVPVTVSAQADMPTPEGREWHLVTYTADGRSHRVPGTVDVTLTLEAGQGHGSSGCQGYAALYEIDGEALAFDRVGPTSEVACPEVAAEVEAAYMAALPRTARWAIDTGVTADDVDLVLFDASGEAILTFVEPSVGSNYADVRELIALVNAQQRQIDRLTRQVAALRGQGSE